MIEGQRLPSVSEATVETMGSIDGHIDLVEAVARLGRENPRLLVSMSMLPPGTSLIAAVALAYEMLHRQADAEWMEANS